MPLSRQSELLGLSRSSIYYRSRKRPQPAEAAVIDAVARLLAAHPHIGSRAIQRMLRESGFDVGRARVLRIMRYLSL